VQVPKASECPSVCAAMHCISSTNTEIGLYVCQTKELEHTWATFVVDYAIKNTSDACGTMSGKDQTAYARDMQTRPQLTA